MKDRIRVGIIGAGNIAGRHFHGYAANADKAVVCCVADPVEATAREKARENNVADVYSDYRDILRRDDVDAVSICTPTKLHPFIAREAFETGKHVLCEKPAGLAVEPFREAMAAAEAAGKVFAMGFCNRCLSNFRVLGDILQSGRIGRPVIARTGSFAAIGHRNPVFCDAAANGGPFIDMFCHWVDEWSEALKARVVSVAAAGFAAGKFTAAPAGVGTPAIDTGEAVLTFDTGDIGVLAAGWLLPDVKESKLLGQSYPDSFVGPDGFILGGSRNVLKVVTANGVEEFHNDGTLREAAHSRQVAAFCDAIHKGTPPAAGAEAGLYTLRVSLAVLKSIEEGRPVAIKEI